MFIKEKTWTSRRKRVMKSSYIYPSNGKVCHHQSWFWGIFGEKGLENFLFCKKEDEDGSECIVLILFSTFRFYTHKENSFNYFKCECLVNTELLVLLKLDIPVTYYFKQIVDVFFNPAATNMIYAET